MKKAEKARHRTARIFVAMLALIAMLTAMPMTTAYAYAKSVDCHVVEITAHDDKLVQPVKDVRK